MTGTKSVRGETSAALLPILLASTILAGVPAVALAQAQQNQLEEVVVTAQKRSQNLQNVPMNVTAMTAQSLTQLHLTNFNDFEKFMPSVTFAVSGQGSNGGPGFANITMRGVASDQNGNHSGPLPTVGVYFDESPITTIGGTLDIPTYDVQRVEALSGPQGTLYGASSESGTIRIISNKPDTDGLYGSISANVNSVDHGGTGYGANGFVNIPLSDKMAIRLVGWGEHDAGYIDNVHNVRTYPTSGITIDNGGPGTTLDTTNRIKSNYNTVDKYGARAALEIDLDDNWTVTPVVIAQSETSNGFFGYDPHIGDLKVGHFTPEYVKDNWYQANLTVQGKIANLDVIYAGSYMNRMVKSEADYSDYAYWYDTLNGSGAYFYDNLGNLVDPTQYIVGKDLFTKQSHELRISTPKDDRFRVVGGLFYERQSHHILQDYKVVGNIADSITVPGWPNTIWLTDQLRVDRDYAAFAQADFDITPKLTFTAGIRGFYADNSLQGFFGFSSGFSSHTGVAICKTDSGGNLLPAIVPGGPCTDLDARVHESGETHKLGLTYHVTDNKMVYFTYSTGFRPGGVNRRNDIPGVGPYSSDTLDNYEIGWKTSWLDNRLRFNGDIYLEDWNNFQFPYLGPSSVTIIANAGQAQIKGAEAQVSWLPIDSLTLTGNVAYNDAQLAAPYCGGDCATNAVQSPTGTQLPITPKWKLNAIARYEFQLAGLNAHIQGDMVHQSGTWPDLRLYQRSLLGQNKAYTMFDFAAGVGLNNWLVELSIQNAFDERAQLGRFAACTPETCGFQTYILPSQPRTLGLTFTEKFGGE